MATRKSLLQLIQNAAEDAKEQLEHTSEQDKMYVGLTENNSALHRRHTNCVPETPSQLTALPNGSKPSCTILLDSHIDLVDQFSVAPDRRSLFILTSYRPDGCTSLWVALFGVHNQTVNIWSHLLGLFVVANYFNRSDSHHTHVAMLHAHAAVVFFTGIASVAYHVGECLPRPFRDVLLVIDFCGAYSSCASHAALITFFELGRTNHEVAAGILWAIGFSVVAGLPLIILAKICNVPKYVMASVMGLPLLLGIAAWVLAHPTPSTPLLARWAATFACAVGVWVFHLPERLLPSLGLQPGSLDLVFNSHNVMHVLVLYVFCEIQAIYGNRLSWAVGSEGT
mmetsp:Transcript_23531/g.38848  ORF Transcript_23531/g.38848 Transcript_23531/m.38848 type:complete len:339 (-) Transcript_23531:154-1170(-)